MKCNICGEPVSFWSYYREGHNQAQCPKVIADTQRQMKNLTDPQIKLVVEEE
jgi:hypothetical protein